MKKLIAEILACLSVAACAVQPATHADLPATVKTVAPVNWSVEAPQDAVDAKTWWSQFGDPVLDQLVDSVLNGNLDLQAAAERVKQAQAVTTQKHAVLLPELDATATASDSRINTPPPLGYVRQGGVGLALNWSPDVFGGGGSICWPRRRNSLGKSTPRMHCGLHSRLIPHRPMSICAGPSRNCRFCRITR
jgi:hypothetical protein